MPRSLHFPEPVGSESVLCFRLWTCLVENPAPGGPPDNDDRAIGLRFFITAVKKAVLVLDPAIKKQLLLEKITRMPPGGLSDKAWDCFEVFFLEVNHEDGCLQQGSHNDSLTKKIDLSGTHFQWVMATNMMAESSSVLCRAALLFS